MKKVFNISTKSSETDTNKPSKKRKVFKTLGFSSLALLMGAAGVFAFAPLGNAPMSPNTLNASATTQGQTFDLGLDPQNDPVVYTTESGLEIKKSNGKYSSTTTVSYYDATVLHTKTQDLRSFYYFTMGAFSGTIYTIAYGDKTANYKVSAEPINWLIIGRGPGFNFEKSTPAGTGIVNDRDKEEIATSALKLPNFFTTVPEHSDIPEGCMLVLSEKLLGQYYFNATGDVNYTCTTIDNDRIIGNSVFGGRYRFQSDTNATTPGSITWNNRPDGSLYSYINNLFSKNTSGTILQNSLGFTQAQADMVVPQQLYTFYSNGAGYPRAETPSTDEGTYYTMFPLAYRAVNSSTKQNFCIEDYLTSAAQRVACLIGSNNQSYLYHLRSGSAGTYAASNMHVSSVGNFGAFTSSCSLGARPAMVMRLA